MVVQVSESNNRVRVTSSRAHAAFSPSVTRVCAACLARRANTEINEDVDEDAEGIHLDGLGLDGVYVSRAEAFILAASLFSLACQIEARQLRAGNREAFPEHAVEYGGEG